MKKFIYLVQGQADRVRNYLHLAERKQSDALFLTYDRFLEGEGSTFLPHSSWAEGRNRLLNLAQQRGTYLYYIFCDDDISFIRGDWSKFEEQLVALKPAIGVPVVPKTKSYTFRCIDHQIFVINDEQLMAFHHEVIADALVLPYQRQFDDIHWWIACEIQEILIQRFYSSGAVQFNCIEIANDCHGRYPMVESTVCREHSHRWVQEQFITEMAAYAKNISQPMLSKRIALKEYSRFLCRGRYPSHYSVSEAAIKAELREDSSLLAQYICRNNKGHETSLVHEVYKADFLPDPFEGVETIDAELIQTLPAHLRPCVEAELFVDRYYRLSLADGEELDAAWEDYLQLDAQIQRDASMCYFLMRLLKGAVRQRDCRMALRAFIETFRLHPKATCKLLCENRLRLNVGIKF